MASDTASRKADLPREEAPAFPEEVPNAPPQDGSPDPALEEAGAAAPDPSLRARLARLLRSITVHVFSSLTRRIVVLNLAGLIALVGGIFYLNQFREGLIDARVQALLTQGEIMASAVAASATTGSSPIQIDPEKLLEQQATEDEAPSDDAMQALDFPINPERVAPLLRRVVTPAKLRARVYDRDGNLILDSRSLFLGSDIIRSDLPPVTQDKPGPLMRAWTWLRVLFTRQDLPLYQELGSRNGKGYSE